MSIDLKTIKHISKLSRISVDEKRAEKLADDLNSIFEFIEKLNELKTDDVKPLTSIAETTLKFRSDEIKSKNIREQIEWYEDKLKEEKGMVKHYTQKLQ